MLTAYVGPGDPSGLDSLSSEWGHKPTYASDYFDDTSWSGIDNDLWDLGQWEGSGYQMVWGVPMLPTSGGVSLAVGATGAYNQYFTTLAQNLVAAGMGSAVLRLGWEFNEPSFPWYAGGQAAAFVSYWQQIVDTMRTVPGADFQFEWNPSRGGESAPDGDVGDLESYYPGDNYVDILGMDIYDSEDDLYPGATAEVQRVETQTWGLDWLAGFAAANDRPISIPEFGLGSGTAAPDSGPIIEPGPLSGGDDPTFISGVLAWAGQNDVQEVGFWDAGSSGIEDGQNPLTAQALIQSF